MQFNSYSRENSVENRYLYNQGTGEKTFRTERQFDLGLNVDQSRDRTYDYITGRWWQLDPKADQGGQESWSPNHFSFNNPIRYSDPFGDCPECGDDGVEEMTGVIAATVSDGIKGLANIVLAPFGKELSNEGNGITLTMQDRKAPETVGEAILKPVENALNASSILPSSGPTSMLVAKTGQGVKNMAADAVGNVNKSLKQQAEEIKTTLNGNKNSVTVGTSNKQIRYDLSGKAHGKVETPHKQVYNKNIVNGQVKSITRASKEAQPLTQQEIRAIRKYLEKLPKKE